MTSDSPADSIKIISFPEWQSRDRPGRPVGGAPVADACDVDDRLCTGISKTVALNVYTEFDSVYSLILFDHNLCFVFYCIYAFL